VYRTLKLLADAGLAEARRFEDGFTRYEYTVAIGHHDHLICTKCGTIIEFENARIEKLQQDVARKNRFQVKNHKLELYGLCAACQGKRR
jgi:Fur family ferric uptake transcriptional regulator